ESIRYSGSLLKYSLSEEHHVKGFYVIELDKNGNVDVKKENFNPVRDLRSVEGKMDDILKHERNEDNVFINLLDETPVLSPMEKVRSVYPNAIHVERQAVMYYTISSEKIEKQQVEHTELEKFDKFYKEVKSYELTNMQIEINYEVM